MSHLLAERIGRRREAKRLPRSRNGPDERSANQNSKSRFSDSSLAWQAGIHSASVMDEIAKREREVSEIADRLLSSNPELIRSKVKRLRESALDRMHDVRAGLNSDVCKQRGHISRSTSIES